MTIHYRGSPKGRFAGGPEGSECGCFGGPAVESPFKDVGVGEGEVGVGCVLKEGPRSRGREVRSLVYSTGRFPWRHEGCQWRHRGGTSGGGWCPSETGEGCQSVRPFGSEGRPGSYA